MNETSRNLQSTIETFIQQAQFDALIDTCKAALSDARNRSDKITETMSIIGLAYGHQYVGKFKEARILIEGALNLAESLKDAPLVVRAAIASGEIYLKTAYKANDAELAYRQALQAAHDLGDTYSMSEALCGLASMYLQIDEMAPAQRYGREAFDLARASDSRYMMCLTLSVIGAAVTRSQPEKATQAFEDAMAIAQQDNFRLLEVQLFGRIGYLLSREERYRSESILMLEKAYALAQDFRSVPDEFRAIYHMGRAHEEQGSLDLAMQYYDMLLEYAQKWKARSFEGIAFFNLGILAYNRTHYDDAIANFEHALAIARETKNPYQEAQAEQVLGSSYLNSGDFDEALDHYMSARSIYDALDNNYMTTIMLQRIIMTYFQRIFARVLGWLGFETPSDSNTD